MATPFEDAIAQAMASGAMYFAENRDKFRGSTHSLVEHFREPAASFAGYRGDLLEAILTESA